MSIERLNIHNLRNLKAVNLSLDARCNVFYGPNGSGKTSLLESVYLLGAGHSFRSRDVSSLISTDSSSFVVYGKTFSNETVSIQKSKDGTFVRLNQRPCSRSSELASFLPCQVFYQDIFEIINAGPSVRRSLLDWGLFHVKQSYHDTLKSYRRILKQRNSLLRQKAAFSLFAPWNKSLVDAAYLLDASRREYIESWSLKFNQVLAELTDLPCDMRYEKGWDKKQKGTSLGDILIEQFDLDVARQYTHSGAHQADISLVLPSLNAKLNLSRGQQKLILIALKISQALLLDKPCIYLFDDITLELDKAHIQRLFKLLETIPGQFIFSTIDPAVFMNFYAFNQTSYFVLTKGVVAPHQNVSRETQRPFS